MIGVGCIKFLIVVFVIKYVEDGKVLFLDKIKIEDSDKVYGIGIFYEFNNREYILFELLIVMFI